MLSELQGGVCSENGVCCHTEKEITNQSCYLTQSHYADIEPTSPSADHVAPDTWQGSHWSTNFEVAGMTWGGGKPDASAPFEADMLQLGHCGGEGKETVCN